MWARHLGLILEGMAGLGLTVPIMADHIEQSRGAKQKLPRGVLHAST